MKALIPILIFFLRSSTGEPRAVCPDPVVSVKEGGDVFLPCYIDPPVDLSGYTVDWRDDLKELAYLYRHRQVEPHRQVDRYRGRVKVSPEGLSRGDLTLQLLSTRLSDNRTYRCNVQLPGQGTSCTVQFTVTKDEGNRTKIHDHSTTTPPLGQEAHAPGSGGAETEWNMGVLAAVVAVALIVIILIIGGLWIRYTDISERCRSRRDQPKTPEITPMNGSQPMDEHDKSNGSNV